MLVVELENKIKELNDAIRHMKDNGIALAQAEHDYKVAQSKEELRLRDMGMPVTILGDVVRGIPTIADLRQARDIAQVCYDANRENINSIKLQIRILQNQISQEWGYAKYE